MNGEGVNGKRGQRIQRFEQLLRLYRKGIPSEDHERWQAARLAATAALGVEVLQDTLLKGKRVDGSALSSLMGAHRRALLATREPTEKSPSFRFGDLHSAAEILQAQRDVARAMGDGSLSPVTAKTMIEALTLMLRSYDATELESRLGAIEEEAEVAATIKVGPPMLRVIEVPSDDNPLQAEAAE
jgi:hypothetical protein